MPEPSGGAPDSRLLRILEERTGLVTAWTCVMDEPVRGGARWAYTLGSLLLALLGAQVLTGLALSFEYAPSTSSAFESVSRLSDPEQAPWGRLARAMHHHGASFLVVAASLHLAQVAFFGAYRRPREARWLTGVGLLGLLLALAFTGSLLPWDDRGFTATRVGLNIMGGTPVVGPPLAELLQGGTRIGNLTLTRFHALHVVALPAGLGILLGAHLALFRRGGVTPDPRRPPTELARSQPFWPHQALRDLLVAVVVVGALLAVAAAWPAPLGEKADASRFVQARPEWYFLWLYQLLHHFEPPLEWLGTFGIPGLVVAFLVLLPWLDRSADARPGARKLPLAGLALVLALVGGLTAQVFVQDLRGGAAAAAPPESTRAVAAVSPVQAALLFGEKCTECHARDGSPVDPDARDFRTRDFERMARADFAELVRVVKEGDDDGIMPSFADELTDAEIHAILEHVVLRFPEWARESRARPEDEAGGPAR